MIDFLEGVVAEIREESVVVRAGPVGLELLAPKATLMQCSAGDAVHLHTHLAVREDALTLYGFHSEDLRALFGHLLGVTGIGPKLAISVLGALTPQVIASAVIDEDPALLSAAPGVGKRTAERIILELKTKLPEHLLAGPAGGATPRRAISEAAADAVAALIALGYREAKVKSVVMRLAGDNPDDGAETLIRKALADLR